MLSWMVHYKNKYPGGRVSVSESAIDVYDADGNHRVAMRKSADGQFHCRSEEFGCTDCHDLSPIPKDARLYKVIAGKISKDEEFEARHAEKDAFMVDGKIESCEVLKKQKKMIFDEKQRLIK